MGEEPSLSAFARAVGGWPRPGPANNPSWGWRPRIGARAGLTSWARARAGRWTREYGTDGARTRAQQDLVVLLYLRWSSDFPISRTHGMVWIGGSELGPPLKRKGHRRNGRSGYRIFIEYRESKKERGKETRSQRRTCWEGSIRWPARLKKSSAALLHRHVCFRFVRSLHVACSQLPASKLRRRMKIRSVHPSTTHDELAIPIVQTRQSQNAC